MRCCVPFCKNTSDHVSTSEGDRNGISFHGFPSKVHLRAAWLRALGKQDSHLPDSAVVCSQHFLNDDIYVSECGTRQIATGAIPSTVQVCLICLDTDSKLILMSKNKLEETYERLTGHPLCDQGNLKQTLCVQCAKRLMNFSRFRDKSLRARALMMDLVDKHELITKQHIKMIDRTKHQLKSNMVLTTLGADHCDLHILEHPSEDKQTELEETYHRDVVKTEECDDSMSVYDDNNVNDSFQDPLKNESTPVLCKLCLEEFVDEHAHKRHIMSVHLQNGEGDGECDTSQVCAPHTAVSSSSSHSSHSSLITENKQADPGPSRHAAYTSVAPGSATFVTNNENKVHTIIIEADAEQKVNVVSVCGIFKKIKTLSQVQPPTKTRKSVSDIQNIATKDFSYQATSQNEVPTPVNSSSRAKVMVPKTLQSITDNIDMKSINSSQYSSQAAKGSVICDICQKNYKQKSLLVKHIKRHAEVRFTCKICQHKCVCKSHLTEHMRTHTGEKPFTCKICNIKFARNDNLVRHIRIHMGIKPYACELCEYKCAQKNSLAQHIRSHTGDKPYSCNVCEYKSASYGNLQYHMTTHTGEKRFTCKICNKNFSRRGNLVCHMRTHRRSTQACNTNTDVPLSI